MASEILEAYHNAKPIKACHLDARYFDLVLHDFDGLIEMPIVLKIDVLERKKTREGWEQGLEVVLGEADDEVIELTSGAEIKLARVVIDVDDNGRNYRHSNLLIFDAGEKKVMRFEPLKNNPYSLLINTFFTDLFKLILPDYKYSELKLHPQELSKKCPGEGLCVAYVIKLAAMISVGETVHFSNNPKLADQDIRKFAAELVHYYGDLQGPEDIEYAIDTTEGTLLGAGAGGLLGYVVGGGPGLVIGALGGAAAGHYLSRTK